MKVIVNKNPWVFKNVKRLLGVGNILMVRLDTIQDFFVQVGHETIHAAIRNHHFSTTTFHCQTSVKPVDK